MINHQKFSFLLEPFLVTNKLYNYSPLDKAEFLKIYLSGYNLTIKDKKTLLVFPPQFYKSFIS